VTKTLVGLRLEAMVVAGSEVMAEGRQAGIITSVAYSSALDAPIALAILKRPYNSPGTVVHISEQTATVVTLPIVQA